MVNVLFDKVLIHHGGAGFFMFFGVESWAEFNMIPQQEFIHGLALYLREQLTFFTTLPIVIIYYLIKSFL